MKKLKVETCKKFWRLAQVLHVFLQVYLVTCILADFNSDGQKLTKKLPTKIVTNFFSQTNSLTKKIV